MTEERTLLVEVCRLCERPQTIVVLGGESRPVCPCCGGVGVDRDRWCRHHGPQTELPLRPQ